MHNIIPSPEFERSGLFLWIDKMRIQAKSQFVYTIGNAAIDDNSMFTVRGNRSRLELAGNNVVQLITISSNKIYFP